MPTENCRECVRLQYDVITVLEKIQELIMVQLEAFRANDHAKFARLDKELELAIGEKERAIGAMRSTQQRTRWGKLVDFGVRARL